MQLRQEEKNENQQICGEFLNDRKYRHLKERIVFQMVKNARGGQSEPRRGSETFTGPTYYKERADRNRKKALTRNKI